MLHLRFPIGKYSPPEHISFDLVQQYIREIEELPAQLEAALVGVTEEQLDTPYRPGGWTVRQVVHHIADSHINAYCRFKLGVTEEHPTIKPYMEERWAEQEDYRLPIESSLAIIRNVHLRLVVFLRSLRESDFSRTVFHPEHGKVMRLDFLAGSYSWHGRHHLGHVRLVVG